jgi:hypothetical protein
LNQLAVEKEISGFVRDFGVVGFLGLISDFLLFPLPLVQNDLFQRTQLLVRRPGEVGELTVRCLFESLTDAIPMSFIERVTLPIEDERSDERPMDRPSLRRPVIVFGIGRRGMPA